MKSPLLVAALLWVAACSDCACGSASSPGLGGRSGATALAETKPASLTLLVPSSGRVAPKCREPGIEVRLRGSDLGCGFSCRTGAETCTVLCPDHLGLRSDTPYEFVIVYTTRTFVASEAKLGTLTLSPGENQAQVAREQVTLVDLNGDGKDDLGQLCP
jgi:hypothetical protein